MGGGGLGGDGGGEEGGGGLGALVAIFLEVGEHEGVGEGEEGWEGRGLGEV